MYVIVRTKSFENSYKKLKRSGTLSAKTKQKLERAIDMLATGKRLSKEYKDHNLLGELKNYRECHIKGDVLLVYQRIQKELVLILVDVGSHSELFG